jgi:hypothetical protein
MFILAFSLNMQLPDMQYAERVRSPSKLFQSSQLSYIISKAFETLEKFR